MDTIESVFSREEFTTIVKEWKAYAAQKPEGQSEYHLLYAIMRGKDVFKVYSPITNQIRLANNGNEPYQTLKKNLSILSSGLNYAKRRAEAMANPTDANAYIRKQLPNSVHFQLAYPFQFYPYTLTQIEFLKNNVDEISKKLTSV